MEYVEELMPPETPLAFGLHPNAEIGFKLREGVRFCGAVLALQPREAGAEGGLTIEEKVRAQVQSFNGGSMLFSSVQRHVCILYVPSELDPKHI